MVCASLPAEPAQSDCVIWRSDTEEVILDGLLTFVGGLEAIQMGTEADHCVKSAYRKVIAIVLG